MPDPYLGIYSLERLRALGLTTSGVRRKVGEGKLTRIRSGWFAAPDAPLDAVAAVRVGGILTATSGSRHHGLWTLSDGRLHVLVARNASRVRTNAGDGGGPLGVCLHWAKGAISRAVPVADSSPDRGGRSPLPAARDSRGSRRFRVESRSASDRDLGDRPAAASKLVRSGESVRNGIDGPHRTTAPWDPGTEPGGHQRRWRRGPTGG